MCVLLADIQGDAETVAVAIAGQVMGARREPFRVDGQEFELGATVGASLFPRDADDEDGLLRHADAALLEAKQRHRGGLVFSGGATSDALPRLLLPARLRAGLSQGHLYLDFQPIFR